MLNASWQGSYQRSWSGLLLQSGAQAALRAPSPIHECSLGCFHVFTVWLLLGRTQRAQVQLRRTVQVEPSPGTPGAGGNLKMWLLVNWQADFGWQHDVGHHASFIQCDVLRQSSAAI